MPAKPSQTRDSTAASTTLGLPRRELWLVGVIALIIALSIVAFAATALSRSGSPDSLTPPNLSESTYSPETETAHGPR